MDFYSVFHYVSYHFWYIIIHQTYEKLLVMKNGLKIHIEKNLVRVKKNLDTSI